jgi:hypothetical protein
MSPIENNIEYLGITLLETKLTELADMLSYYEIDGLSEDMLNKKAYELFTLRRDYDINNTDVFIARSKDGGNTFENVKISESPFMPSSSVFFGDYTNITAHDGKIRPIWARADGISMSIWTAIIDVTTDIAKPTQQMPFSLAQNYPNPFRESTYISYKLRNTSMVTLSVYDIYGRQVAVIVNNKNMEAGKYIEQFNATRFNIHSGVYYFTLQIGNVIKKQKMILVD